MSRTLILMAATLAFCLGAGGQTATGILQGRVVDATGAAVPDAKVTIENETTGVKQSLVTNTEGTFFAVSCCPATIASRSKNPAFSRR